MLAESTVLHKTPYITMLKVDLGMSSDPMKCNYTLHTQIRGQLDYSRH